MISDRWEDSDYVGNTMLNNIWIVWDWIYSSCQLKIIERDAEDMFCVMVSLTGKSEKEQ